MPNNLHYTGMFVYAEDPSRLEQVVERELTHERVAKARANTEALRAMSSFRTITEVRVCAGEADWTLTFDEFEKTFEDLL